MIVKRPSDERGLGRRSWLESRHSFSFGDYYDPKHMGFRALRVINEDTVAPKGGFPTHGHRDMEILTYVLDGALAHKDSLGNGSAIRPGEVQLMHAGTGIEHSEFNNSDKEPVHLLQIWILPDRAGLAPGYQQQEIPAGDGALRLIASREGADGSLTIHQDVGVYAAKLKKGERAELSLKPGRHAWVQVARGAVTVNNTKLDAGDGAAVSDETKLAIAADAESEILVFDLA